jgi:ectoine hydroxylase-related dioxygenase (phytanoyl-CoA dioxygenase family)
MVVFFYMASFVSLALMLGNDAAGSRGGNHPFWRYAGGRVGSNCLQVRQMAAETTDIPVKSLLAAECDPAATAALQADGVVRARGVLSGNVASCLLEHVNASLEIALKDTQTEPRYGGEWCARFGDVMSPTNRHDVKLNVDAPQVRAGLAEVLSALEPTITASLGVDAYLYELAALVSLPGASRQPVHSDLSFDGGNSTEQGASIVTAFAALQDIDATMGATLFLPATHSAEVHSNFFTYDNFDLVFSSGDEEDEEYEVDEEVVREREARMQALLEDWSAWRAELKAGDVSLFDSRCLHAGDANTSQRQRVLFYCSFIRARDASKAATKGTLLDSLRGRHKLADWREWTQVAAPQQD